MTNTLEVSPTRAENTCVCGHTESEHSEIATSLGHPCEAVEPETCSCLGFRVSKRLVR